MPKTKARSKSAVSTALRELRHRAGFSQEALARELMVALQTITLWETKRPPAGIMLVRLSQMAEKYNYDDLKTVFEEALAKLPVAVAAEIEQERHQWAALDGYLGEIEEEAKRLKEAGNPSGKVIYDRCNDMWQALGELQKLAWRNQR